MDTGIVLGASTTGGRCNIVIQKSSYDTVNYFVTGGDPLDFPVNAAVELDGNSLTVDSISYAIGRYDQWLNTTELTAV